MKTKTVQVNVPATMLEKRVYVAFDGKEFDHAEECIRHEKTVRYSKIRSMENNTFYPFGNYYYVDSEETLQFLWKDWECGESMSEVNIGDWICFFYESNPNGKDSSHVAIARKVMEELLNLQD